MSERKSKLVLLLLSAGMLIVGLSWWFVPTAPNQTLPTENRIARVDRDSGSVSVFRSGYTRKELLNSRTFVFDLDSVETDDIGEATFTFESAYRVKILPSSLVTIESQVGPEEAKVTLIIKRGDIRIENYGLEGQLFIGKNGERILASEYHKSPLNQIIAENPDNLVDLGPAADTQDSKQIQEDEISAAVTRHRPSFFKCYTQVLQKKPSAKGQVSLSFSVNNSGKVEFAEVTYSDIDDQEFRACLKEVTSRIVFRKFEGPSIAAVYPMTFE